MRILPIIYRFAKNATVLAPLRAAANRITVPLAMQKLGSDRMLRWGVIGMFYPG